MTEILSPFMSKPDDHEDTILSTVGRIMDHQEVRKILKIRISNEKRIPTI